MNMLRPLFNSAVLTGAGLYLFAVAVTFLSIGFSSTATATQLSCPAESGISVDFENGAGWDMCWESRLRENIVLSDIHYRAVDSAPYKVISSLRLAQLHVTYDDNEVTYNDVTQFGLGGGHVSPLFEADCPDGELVDIDGIPRMCKRLSRGDEAYHVSGDSRLAEVLTLFTVSHVGAYAYLVTWKFYDDGSIAPSIGAAGALQRSSDDEHSPHGRALGGVKDKSWLSHTHNYYWRIDFDLGDDATDDVVSEVTYSPDARGRRVRQVEQLQNESAREINAEELRAWYINSGTSDVTRAPGYLIEPLSYGHKLVHKETEPFTEFDLFVTRQKDCERYINENAKFNPDCGDDILQFTNNESLINEDIVVWHRISFHHVPRNEDRHQMHSHWDGFLMRAANLSSVTPGHSGIVDNSHLEMNPLPDRQNSIFDDIEILTVAGEKDTEQLTFAVSGLPEGIGIDESGALTGRIESAGVYDVRVTVSDSVHSSTSGFTWRVEGNGSGVFGPAVCFICMVFVIIRRKA